MITRTHTRTHVYVEFANPYLICDRCQDWVTSWHDNDRCGCEGTFWNMPCEHERAGLSSVCPSWGPVDGCSCSDPVPHSEPPERVA